MRTEYIRGCIAGQILMEGVHPSERKGWDATYDGSGEGRMHIGARLRCHSGACGWRGRSSRRGAEAASVFVLVRRVLCAGHIEQLMSCVRMVRTRLAILARVSISRCSPRSFLPRACCILHISSVLVRWSLLTHTSFHRARPYWELSSHSASVQAVLRARVWGEVVVMVRAAAKALVAPLALLQATAGLPPSFGGVLSLMYLAPWAYENRCSFALRSLQAPHFALSAEHVLSRLSFAALYRHQLYGIVNGVRRFERRNLRNNTPRATRDDDCGAARVAPLGRIEPSVALETILTSLPSKVFIKAGDVCCICLEVTKNPDPPLVGCRA